MTTALIPVASPALNRAQRTALLVGVCGLVGFAVGALVERNNLAVVFRSYLVAWTFWLGIALGCLAVVMIHAVAGGTWGIVLRRPLAAGMQTLPLLAVFFVPIALNLSHLYPWVESREPALADKQAHYLNVPFFIIRTTAYFAIWITIAFLLYRWFGSRNGAAGVVPDRVRMLSGPGLVLYGLTVTFAAIDWVMSLEPHWYSSIFGVMFGMGQLLSAFALAVAAAVLLIDGPGPEQLRDLGGLLLAFVMAWAYLSFSQFLLIWAGNLPDEIPWYLRRLRGGWEWVGLALVLFQFALPFFLLLSSDMKRNRRTLVAVAGLVLVMRLVDLFWLIVPAHDDLEEPARSGLAVHWRDVPLSAAMVAGLGGVWVAFFLWQFQRTAAFPEVIEHG